MKCKMFFGPEREGLENKMNEWLSRGDGSIVTEVYNTSITSVNNNVVVMLLYVERTILEESESEKQ